MTSRYVQTNEDFKEKLIKWVSMWRKFPHRFINDFLDVQLTFPQAVSIKMMNESDQHVFIASRGFGKTFVVSGFCLFRAILYPGTNIVISSGTLAQANLVIRAIKNIWLPKSKLLEREIEELQLTSEKGEVIFSNGSQIRSVTSRETARGGRSDILIIDEYRMVDKHIYDSVLLPINSLSRNPEYTRREQYKHLINAESGKFIFMSSAWFQYHWSFDKYTESLNGFLSEQRTSTAIAIPYNFALADEISSETFFKNAYKSLAENETSWAMEYEAIFYKQISGSVFNYEDLEKLRTIYNPLYTSDDLADIDIPEIDIERKHKDEINVISCDPAFVGGGERDFTSITIVNVRVDEDEKNPANSKYLRRQVYKETIEGGSAEITAQRIRELYHDMECDYIVLDRANMGLEIYYQLGKEIDLGGFYSPGFASMNNKDLEKRNLDLNPNAEKVVYTVYANETFNASILNSLTQAVRTKSIQFLATNVGAEKHYMETIEDLSDLSNEKKAKLLKPFYETSAMLEEVSGIQVEMVGTRRRIKYTTKRNDRYTSLAYANYFIDTLEAEYRKEQAKKNRSGDTMFAFY